MQISSLITATTLFLGAAVSLQVQAEKPLIHDAEYKILEAQNGENWKKEE